MRKILSYLLRRHPEVAQRTVPWTHYVYFGDHGEYLIGMHRLADGRELGERVELFRLPGDHDRTDVRVKVHQAMRQADAANESWSSST